MKPTKRQTTVIGVVVVVALCVIAAVVVPVIVTQKNSRPSREASSERTQDTVTSVPLFFPSQSPSQSSTMHFTPPPTLLPTISPKTPIPTNDPTNPTLVNFAPTQEPASEVTTDDPPTLPPTSFQPTVDVTSRLPLACKRGASWHEFLRLAASESQRCRQEEQPCQCRNPTQPFAVEPSQRRYRNWNAALLRNQVLIMEESIANRSSPLDILFLGDSLTEHWTGTHLTIPKSEWSDNQIVFQQLFNTSNNKDARYNGLPLGASGDSAWHVLYRLQRNGGMVFNNDALQPRIWWLLIGTNDWNNDCTVDMITAGNLAIVQYIAQRQPNATIVINSLLPRGSRPIVPTQQINPLWHAFTEINRRLDCFARSHTKIYFFNATHLFLYKDGVLPYHVDETLLPDRLHPNGNGAMVWGRAMVEFVSQILLLEQ